MFPLPRGYWSHYCKKADGRRVYVKLYTKCRYCGHHWTSYQASKRRKKGP